MIFDLIVQAESFLGLSSGKNDLGYALNLSQELLKFEISNDPEFAYAFFNERTELALEILYLLKVEYLISDNTSSLVESVILLAKVLRLKGRIGESVSELKNTLEIIQGNQDLLFEVYRELGNSYFHRDFNLVESVSYYELAMKIGRLPEEAQWKLQHAREICRSCSGNKRPIEQPAATKKVKSI